MDDITKHSQDKNILNLVFWASQINTPWEISWVLQVPSHPGDTHDREETSVGISILSLLTPTPRSKIYATVSRTL